MEGSKSAVLKKTVAQVLSFKDKDIPGLRGNPGVNEETTESDTHMVDTSPRGEIIRPLKMQRLLDTLRTDVASIKDKISDMDSNILEIKSMAKIMINLLKTSH